MTGQIRVQVISDAPLVQALKEKAIPEVSFTDHNLQDNDQHVGLVEVAAVVALATSIAKLAEILVKVYKELRSEDPEITLRSANGVVTIKGRDLEQIEVLMERLKQIS